MATISQTQPTIEDFLDQARILRAQTFSRAAKQLFTRKTDTDTPASESKGLMQEDIYFLPLVHGVQAIVKTIVTAYRRNAMRRQLLALDDRMLRDIGIRRDDIPSLIAGAFAGTDRVPGSTRTAAELYYLVPAAEVSTVRSNDRLAA